MTSMTFALSCMPRIRRIHSMHRNLLCGALGALALLVLALNVVAATNTGTALQGAYTQLNDMINGYGKQLLIVVGFAVAAIGFIATNATGVIMKFVGYSIFLGVGLAGAITVVGAVI